MAKINKPKVFNYTEFKVKALEPHIGFVCITGAELKIKIPNSNFFDKNIVLDDETFFIYEIRGLMMLARPKFSEEKNVFIRSKGGAKVLIISMSDHKVVYASKMFYQRSSRFWSDLGNYAYITKLKIFGRPICHCLHDMHIAFQFTNQVYWVCRKRSLHEDNKNVTMQWDIGLGRVFTDFLKINRKRNRKYLKKLSKQYKKFGKVVVRRSRL